MHVAKLTLEKAKAALLLTSALTIVPSVISPVYIVEPKIGEAFNGIFFLPQNSITLTS